MLERQLAGPLLQLLKERLEEREVDVLVRRAGVFGRPQTLAEIDRSAPISAPTTDRRPPATPLADRRSQEAARARAKASDRNPAAASVS